MERRRLRAPVFRSCEVPGAAVGQLVVLEMSPDVFGGVEFRCIGRQLLDLNGAVEASRYSRTSAERCAARPSQMTSRGLRI